MIPTLLKKKRADSLSAIEKLKFYIHGEHDQRQNKVTQGIIHRKKIYALLIPKQNSPFRVGWIVFNMACYFTAGSKAINYFLYCSQFTTSETKPKGF